LVGLIFPLFQTKRTDTRSVISPGSCVSIWLRKFDTHA